MLMRLATFGARQMRLAPRMRPIQARRLSSLLAQAGGQHQAPLAQAIRQRGYGCINRIEDMLQASEAWHQASNLSTGLDLMSDASLRLAFDRIVSAAA